MPRTVETTSANVRQQLPPELLSFPEYQNAQQYGNENMYSTRSVPPLITDPSVARGVDNTSYPAELSISLAEIIDEQQQQSQRPSSRPTHGSIGGNAENAQTYPAEYSMPRAENRFQQQEQTQYWSSTRPETPQVANQPIYVGDNKYGYPREHVNDRQQNQRWDNTHFMSSPHAPTGATFSAEQQYQSHTQNFNSAPKAESATGDRYRYQRQQPTTSTNSRVFPEARPKAASSTSFSASSSAAGPEPGQGFRNFPYNDNGNNRNYYVIFNLFAGQEFVFPRDQDPQQSYHDILINIINYMHQRMHEYENNGQQQNR